MPHQPNYVQILSQVPHSFSVSRIAESEADTDILVGRLPGEFGFDADDNIELHFYDSQNTLVNSTLVPINTGIVSARTVILSEGQKEEKIVIDMTRVQKELGLYLVPGVYTLVINLFSDEIGSYKNKKLTVQEISDSRTELRLAFNVAYSDAEEQELYEFLEPSIPRVLAAGVVGSVMGIESDNLITGPTDTEEQSKQFVDEVNSVLLDIIPTLQEDLSNLEPDLQTDLDTTIEYASTVVYDEFIKLLEITKNSNKFDRLQSAELDVLIEEAVQNAFVNNNMELFVNGKIHLVPTEIEEQTMNPNIEDLAPENPGGIPFNPQG